jgi:hypothetical protein
VSCFWYLDPASVLVGMVLMAIVVVCLKGIFSGK